MFTKNRYRGGDCLKDDGGGGGGGGALDSLQI